MKFSFDDGVASHVGRESCGDAPPTGTGSTGALSYGTSPTARVSYTASWFDGVDRSIASANYGAIASFTRPDAIPTSTATVLVNGIAYDDAGRVYQTTDPKGIIAQTGYDDAGRKTQTIEDQGGLNRTTNFTYTLDDLISTMTAVNSSTGDQTTTYIYGTTLTESEVARNDLLRFIAYPDATLGWSTLSIDDWASLTVDEWAALPLDPVDTQQFTYNRLSQNIAFTDQRETFRTFLDKAGVARRGGESGIIRRPISRRINGIGF